MRIILPTGTPAELVKPLDGRPSTRGLVLWPDIFGLRPLFVQHAQRLANDHGWTVVVVEPYPGNESMTIAERQEFAKELNDDAKLADTVAAAELMELAQVGVLGFCQGGMWAMKALASQRINRAVAFYGMVRVPPQWQGGGLGDAIDVVTARAADGDLSLLCIFGTDDPWCPAEEIAEIEAAGATVKRYEGAGHGWAQDPDREGYLPVEAADAWARAEQFLGG